MQRKFREDVKKPGYNKLVTGEMGGRFVLGTTNSPYMLPGVTNNTFHVSVGGDFSGSLLGAVTNSTNINSHNTQYQLTQYQYQLTQYWRWSGDSTGV